MPTGTLPRIVQRPDGVYMTPDGHGGWAEYTGQLPDGTSAATSNPNAFKVGDTDEISHTWDLLDSINAARELSRKPLATGMPAQTITSVPVVGGLVGQNHANLQVKLGSIAGALRQMGIKSLYEQTGQKGVGSIARNQSEQQALQSSLAPLGYVDQGGHVVAGPSPDEATLNQGLDTAQNLFLRHQARLLGLNPDDPQAMQALTSAVADPSKRQMLLNSVKKDGSAAPVTGAGTPPPAATLETSTTNQAHLNPLVAKIAPQLTQMLDAPKWRVPDSQIKDFVRQNGIDPDSWPELQKALPNRGKTQFNVDPHFNEPLTGAKKVMSEVGTFAPGGIPVGPALVAAGDTYTLGAAPDIAGIVHAVTGAGPTRDDVIQARDASAAENPAATFIGNIGGMVANPLARGGGVLRTMGLSGLYSGLGSDDPSIGSRLTNAAVGASVGGLTHTALSGAGRAAQAGYRALKSIVAPILGNGDQVATEAALERAAAAMPRQDVAVATEQLQNMRRAGLPFRAADNAIPAAAALSRGGQEFLSKVASSSPAARAAADHAVSTFRKAVPQALEGDFNQAIADAAPQGAKHTVDFLARPVRDIAGDVQDMAGREYETGMKPILNERVPIDESLADVLSHEQVKPAIADVLRNSKLTPETQAVLRSLPQWIKDGMLSKLPITVDALRHLATNLDTRAAKSNNYVAGDLSHLIRDKIGEAFPEYQPVNSLYASRMRAIDAMHAARENFLGESPEQIDALAKASGKFSDAPNPPEFKGSQSASIPLSENAIKSIKMHTYGDDQLAEATDAYLKNPSGFTKLYGYDKNTIANYIAGLHEAVRSNGTTSTSLSRGMVTDAASVEAALKNGEWQFQKPTSYSTDPNVAKGYADTHAYQTGDEELDAALRGVHLHISNARGVHADPISGDNLGEHILPAGTIKINRSETLPDGSIVIHGTHEPISDAKAEPPTVGSPLPSNRQFAAAGAREAATTKAGAGTGNSGATLLRQIAEGANQGQRNSMVLGPNASNVAARAGARAQVAETVDRIASGPNTDQTANWFKLGKYVIATKATGGAAHYAAARALTSMPNMSGEDAARVVNVYMNADSADQALKSLSKYYGAARARTIMARIAAVAAAGSSTRQPPSNPTPPPNVIGAPVPRR